MATNEPQNTKTRKRKSKVKRRARKRLFIKAFSITLGLMLVLWFARQPIISLLFNMFATPPDFSIAIDPNNPPFFGGDGTNHPDGFSNEDRREQFFTFLIVGLDDEGGGASHTDTIIVGSYDAINLEAHLIGIPRDSKVNIPRNVQKINSAFMVGEIFWPDRGGGIGQLSREVKTIIGFIPDFYIAVDLEAFEKVVDALGGVEVYVPFHMRYSDPVQNLHIDILPGLQILDGENALHFARYRLGAPGHRTITDYERIENQQTVIYAMLERLLRPSSLFQIPRFIDIFNDYLDSNIRPENLLWFANQLRHVNNTDALHTHTLPTLGTSGSPSYYELLDGPAILELINRTINPYTRDIEARHISIAR